MNELVLGHRLFDDERGREGVAIGGSPMINETYSAKGKFEIETDDMKCTVWTGEKFNGEAFETHHFSRCIPK